MTNEPTFQKYKEAFKNEYTVPVDSRSHLVGGSPGDDHDIGLSRAGPEDQPEPIQVVPRCSGVYHLHRAARQSERHRPHRSSIASPSSSDRPPSRSRTPPVSQSSTVPRRSAPRSRRRRHRRRRSGVEEGGGGPLRGDES